MAPQLGMGTFRIDQGGLGDAYAMARGNKEIWGMRTATFQYPAFPSPAVSMYILPILGAPDPLTLTAFCNFLKGIGENPAHFMIREHTIVTRTCSEKK